MVDADQADLCSPFGKDYRRHVGLKANRGDWAFRNLRATTGLRPLFHALLRITLANIALAFCKPAGRQEAAIEINRNNTM
jgi:hypothetical protein